MGFVRLSIPGPFSSSSYYNLRNGHVCSATPLSFIGLCIDWYFAFLSVAEHEGQLGPPIGKALVCKNSSFQLSFRKDGPRSRSQGSGSRSPGSKVKVVGQGHRSRSH